LGVKHKRKTWKWDTIILNKTQELARFLLGKSGSLDFIEPAPSLVSSDSRELRRRILELSAKEAWKLGVSKSTLHDLRKNARSDRSFKVYKKVRKKLIEVKSLGMEKLAVTHKLNEERKRRFLDSMPETIRMILTEYLPGKPLD